ncbi:glycoside hydrolase family 127 protein [Microbispora sp. NBC_01189]|uniref:beta-L-arabinofuranosidase domain-containing protein n=1 Tax=Microbispora sp. NBC_01189 TaxID=2903583 RepID=UPI002E16818A|nr:glycoside hydrolase family 127 protein [Microbispora sp. NBC_01189]
MPPSSLNRRQLLRTAGIAVAASAAAPLGGFTTRAASAAARPDIGVAAHPFDLGQVRLTSGRWLDNQNRTLAYLRFVDADRMVHTFRANAGLASSAQPVGGWEAPGMELRGHFTGHLLSGLAQAYAITGDTAYKTKGDYIVNALAACQTASPSRGYHSGYLSAFPENFFDRVESGQNVWAPWYTLHKIMAGLLDQFLLAGNGQALTVVTNLAGWADWRTGRLSSTQMLNTLNNEFGGMNAVLTDLYQQTGDARWLTAAQRFDHAAVFNPLASNQDQLNGLHANTQVPKWIGAAREYKATGTTRYRDIAVNAWNITVGAHTYVIGGNSQAEHFRAPNAIAAYLTNDTCESCNTYNMLKLTRELFTLYPDRADLFDYYERALTNQMIGQQNPSDPHGHICYFTPLNPGGRRGVSSNNGGYSTDYDSFWCCQGTGLETQTKLADSIYFFTGTTLIVNLFAPSTLNWTQRGITVTQTTSYPASDTTTLQVTGNVSGSWSMRVRIPSWASGATISVNGTQQNVTAAPGTYAVLTRSWTSGDTVTVRLPMQAVTRPANDNPNVVAVTYGPVVLSGNYGNTSLSALPSLNTASITRTGTTALTFTATANGSTVNLGPFYDAHGYNYTVYWNTGGGGGVPTGWVRIANAATGLVLDSGGNVASGSNLKQWNWDGSNNLQWQLVDLGGGWYRIVNRTNGMVADSWGNTANGANARQAAWNGGTNQQWRLNDLGNGRYQIVNRGTGTSLDGMGYTSAGSAVGMWTPNNNANNQFTITAV